MTFLFSIIDMLLGLYDLGLLIYVLLSWVPMQPNSFTIFLRRIMEPVLTPIRGLIVRLMPRSRLQIDISPVVAWVLLRLIRRILAFLLL